MQTPTGRMCGTMAFPTGLSMQVRRYCRLFLVHGVSCDGVLYAVVPYICSSLQQQGFNVQIHRMNTAFPMFGAVQSCIVSLFPITTISHQSNAHQGFNMHVPVYSIRRNCTPELAIITASDRAILLTVYTLLLLLMRLLCSPQHDCVPAQAQPKPIPQPSAGGQPKPQPRGQP